MSQSQPVHSTHSWFSLMCVPSTHEAHISEPGTTPAPQQFGFSELGWHAPLPVAKTLRPLALLAACHPGQRPAQDVQC